MATNQKKSTASGDQGDESVRLGPGVLVASTQRLFLFSMDDQGTVASRPLTSARWSQVEQISLGLGWSLWWIVSEAADFGFAPQQGCAADGFLAALAATPNCYGPVVYITDLLVAKNCVELAAEDEPDEPPAPARQQPPPNRGSGTPDILRRLPAKQSLSAAEQEQRRKTAVAVRNFNEPEQLRLRAAKLEATAGLQGAVALAGHKPPPCPLAAFVPVPATLQSVPATAAAQSAGVFLACVVDDRILVVEATVFGVGVTPVSVRLVWGIPVDHLLMLQFSISRPLELVLCWDPEALSSEASDSEDADEAADFRKNKGLGEGQSAAAANRSRTTSTRSGLKNASNFSTPLHFGDSEALASFARKLNQSYVQR